MVFFFVSVIKNIVFNHLLHRVEKVHSINKENKMHHSIQTQKCRDLFGFTVVNVNVLTT